MAADPIKIKKAARKEPGRPHGRSGTMRTAGAREFMEELRRESERRFSATFEQASVGFTRVTFDGVVLDANQKFCDMLGYPRNEVVGQVVDRFTHPDDQRQDTGDRSRLASSAAKSLVTEKRFMRKDGDVIWVRRTLSLATDDAGAPQYVIGVIEDITDRKRTEARIERLTRARRMMVECHHIMAQSSDETVMLESLCRVMIEAGGYKMTWVGLATSDSMRPVYPAAHAGFENDAPMGGEVAWGPDGRYRGFMSEVIESGEPHIARDILQDPAHAKRIARAKQRGFQSSIALPLKGGGRILGAIALYAADPDAFDDEEITLLKVLANDIAFGIVSLRERIARRNAEAALRESEQRFRETFEQAAVGITRVDLDGVLIDVNGKFCEMMGYGRNELLGKHIRDITHTDDFGMGAQYRAELTHRAMKSAVGEKRFIRKDGSVLWARRTMSTATDPGGKPLYVISVVEDITERKMLERRFELAFNQAAVGMTQSSLDGRLLQVNQKYADMLGYTRDELTGMRIEDLTHRDDRADSAEVMRNLRSKIVESVSSEKRLLCKDGSVIWVNRTSSLVQDNSGEPIHFLAVIEDITGRKEIDNERAQLAAIVESSDDAIISTTLDRRVLSWNAAAERMFGYAAAEVMGRVASFLIPADREAEALERRKRMDPSRPVPAFDTVRIAKDGRRLDVSVTQSPIKGADGRMIGVSLVFRDISERKQAEERYRATFDNAPLGIMHTAIDDDRILHVNPRLCELVGYTPDELLGMKTDDLLHPDHRGRDRGKYRRQMLDGSMSAFSSERVLVRKDGSVIWVNRIVSLVRDATGRPQYFIRVLEDITERTLAGRRLAMEHAITSTLAEAASVGEALPKVIRTICEGLDWTCGFCWSWDRPAELLRCREHWHRDTAGIESFVSASLDMVNEAPSVVTAETAGGLVRQVWGTGAPVWISDVMKQVGFRRAPAAAQAGLHSAFAFPVLSEGRPAGVIEFYSHEIRQPDDALLQMMRAIGAQVGQFIQRKLAEEGLLQLAHYDVLTNLPNRVLFYDRLRQVLAQAKRNEWTVGVLFVDLDRFKNVNDTLGHAVGDQLLKQVSERLSGSVRAGDTVGRLGGDEFAIVLADLSSAQDANVVAQKIMGSFAAPFKLGGSEIYVTASIGITLYPEDSADQDTLIRNADSAMYRSKEMGRNSFQFYTPEMNSRALEILSMESNLRRALDRDEFLLYYQPKASVADGRIVGLEALLRWQHPERGLVSPGEFMFVLEETGLIVPVGEWALRRVCLQIKEWEHAGIRPVPVAVNLSARQFNQKDFGPWIGKLLQAQQVDLGLIDFEITESSIMTNPEEAARTLEYLSGLGIGVSIDDFGTGYSSLSYLKRFPLDSLKIDRSFVRDLSTDSEDAAITRAVISMAHSLGLRVIAEGVETAEQLAFLAAHGCDEIQGYYFSRPLAVADCTEWIRQERRLQRQALPA